MARDKQPVRLFDKEREMLVQKDGSVVERIYSAGEHMYSLWEMAAGDRFEVIREGKDGKTYLAHTLNNTCVAPPRMLIAFLENHLQADGSVTIPKVLQPYMGGLEVMVPTHKKG